MKKKVQHTFEEEIAALLSYFIRELSDDNIISDEVLVYAAPTIDMCTRDVAVIAAIWLEHLIYLKENDDSFWLSFKPWLRGMDPTLYHQLTEFEECGELWNVYTLKAFKDSLDTYNDTFNNVESSNLQQEAEEPRDVVVERLLEELKKVQEYADGSEKARHIRYFEDVKVAALKYVEMNNIQFPPMESYINVLPFHYESEEMKFRDYIQRKKTLI